MSPGEGYARGKPPDRGPELEIRPSPRHRARAALAAWRWTALLMLPIGLLLSWLARSPVWLLVLEGWAVLAACASYFGQRRNSVYVGAGGLRRVNRGCDVIGAWADLEAIEVTVPGQRIVVFRIKCSSLAVAKRGRGRSRAAEMMVRNPPEGFELRLDRESADQLVGQIRERRPDLVGLPTWEVDSRPPASPSPKVS